MAVIDASILMLFLRPDVPVPAAIDRPLERVEYLVKRLEKAREKIIIPSPALAEVLVRASATLSLELVEKINGYNVFRIEPFDTRAAIEVAAMTRDALDGGGRKNTSAATYAKLKYDRQIVAIAKVMQATTIYSDDRHIRTLGKRAKIDVVGLADLPLPPADPQMDLDLEGKQSDAANKDDAGGLSEESVNLDAELGNNETP